MIYYYILIAVVFLLIIYLLFKRKKTKEPYSYELVEKELSFNEEREELLKEAINLYKNKHKKF